MRKLRLPVMIGMSVIFAMGAFSQSPSPSPSTSPANSQGGSLSIEDLYLSQEVEVQVLRTQALANTRDSKQLALQTIRSAVENKEVTADNKEVVAVLEALAGDGVYRIVRQNGAVINDFPDIRRDAVQLLGQIGGHDAKIILEKVAQNDRETSVLSEAVYALGISATESDKDVLVYITKVMIDNNARVIPDDNLAFACLLAVERLATKFNGIGDADVINSLLDIASGNYLKDVRLKAISVISKLRKAKS